MNNFYLLSVINRRIKLFRILLSGLVLCCMSYNGYAAVAVTAATGGTLLCESLSTVGSSPGFTTLGPITIIEGNTGDIPHTCGGTCTVSLTLCAPTGWEFNTAVLPTVAYFDSYTGGAGNITGITRTIVNVGGVYELQMAIRVTGANRHDEIRISGLQVEATTATIPSTGHIYALTGSGISGITGSAVGAGSTSATNTNFGNLSQVSSSTPTVTIAAAPSNTVCPGATVTLNATTTGTISTYQWYVNGILTYTGNPYITSALADGNTVYCKVTSSGCGSATATSNTITMTVTGPGLISGNPLMCVGTTTILTDGTTGGTWSSTATGVATVGSTGISTGVGAGTATISYYPGSGCAAILVVTVSAPPATPVIIPATATICNQGNVTLTATGASYYPPTILSQNFNSGLGTWTVDNSGSVGTVTGAGWQVDGDGYTNELGIYHSPDNSSFVMVNGDTSGTTALTSSLLISPSFSLVGYTSATLSFQQFYNFDGDDLLAEVDVSTDGGTTWTTLQDYWGTTAGAYTAFATETVDMTAYVGLPSVMIEFSYATVYGLSWSVDNVSITGTPVLNGPTWTPSTYLYSDAAFTSVYTGGSYANPVYVHPTTVLATTVVTYNATVTSPTTGCSSTGTSVVTINPNPAAITGIASVCVGLVTSLTDATIGGIWSSTAVGFGSVDGSGNVTGISPGTTTISYTFAGCAATALVTVAAVPGSINGIITMCTGSSTSLSDAITGGTWSSSATATATVNPVSGVVTGIAPGTSVITYATSSVCYVTTTVTVTSPPGVITGTSSVCTGNTRPWIDLTTGGIWTSSNTGIATAGSTGTGNTATITGVSAGTATITYALNSTCYVTKVMTVNTAPTAINGVTLVCSGFTTNLTDAVTGGTWSSSAVGTASVVSTTGVVTGGTTYGTATITYATGCGVAATTVVTVTIAPAAISGVPSVCTGATTSLSDAVPGGTWSSSAPGVASISSAGVVTGITGGTTTISYTTICGSITQVVAVNVTPYAGAITGPSSVCAGLTITLSDATDTGGTRTWSSSNTAAGTVDPTTGIVYGVAAGTTIISLTESTTSCGSVITTASVTVNASPVAGTITGLGSVCSGFTITLSDLSAAGGTGTWSSSNTAVGTVGSTTGVVYGVSAGTTTISFTETTAFCGSATTTTNITVNATPVAGTINGPSSVCTGLTITLSDATASGGTGTWSSSNTAAGTIGSTTGVVYGVAAGVTTIIFTESTALCGTVTTTTNITVNASPVAGAITGLTAVCPLGTITLADAAASGGTGAWSSSNTAVGTVGSTTGVVYGVSAGTTTITFTETTAFCGSATTTTNITVNVAPVAGTITGPSSVCSGLTITLSDATASGGTGTWSSSNTAAGTVGSTTGIVYGVSAGVTTITYTETSVFCGSAMTTTNITVNASPVAGAITGITSVCPGLTTTLNNAAASGGTGTWSSSNTAVGTIGSTTGVVYGVSAGTTIITFTETTAFCGSANTTTNFTVSVAPVAGAINGLSSVCSGLTITLSDATASGGSGTWSSSNTAVGTINSTTGVVYGVSAGTTTITFTETSVSCGSAITTTNITVNASPVAGVITGLTSMCVGTTTSLSDAAASGGTGTWSSSNTAVGTVGSTTGVVYGVGSGTTITTFTETTAFCGSATTTTTVTVVTSPVAGTITGPTSVCTGQTITLSNATAFGGTGTWSSSNNAVGSIGSSTGVVYGVTPGIITITFTETTGSCGTATTTTNVTVNISPVAGAISGLSSVCAGSTITLNNLTASGGTGTWSSSNTAVGTIDPVTGILYGVSAGTTIVTYTETSVSCGSVTTTTNITVNASPVAGTINGLSAVCVGSTITLSDATAAGGSGTWSSSNTAIGTVGATTGVVYGVSPGPIVITFTETTAFCGSATTTANVTVNVSPIAGAITGLTSVCAGANITLNNFTASGGTGTWSSSNTAVGTIDPVTGIVYGVSAGTTRITYVETSAFCGSATTTTNITVNASPVAGTITGPSSVCAGSTITLSDATAAGGSGTWSSNNTAVGTIGAATGVVYGVSPGITMITFTETTTFCGSATTTTNITVNVSPVAGTITGPTSVCVGANITLNDLTASGGTGAWSSSNTLVGTIDPVTGIVYGVGAGVTTITFTETSAFCGAVTTTTNITVNPNPSAITGTPNVCIGLTTTLNSTPGTGTWSSVAGTGNASVGSASGVASGLSAGTVTIIYTLPTSCNISTVITVNANPTTITGAQAVCIGLTTTLNSTPAGGTWSSTSGHVGVGGTSGVITGLSTGTALIVYTLPTGCINTATVTVNPLPSPITGTLAVCVGAITTLTDAGGGTWSLSNGNAIIGSVSVVSGVTAGTDTVTYTLPTGCITTSIMTINSLPANITGTMSVCSGLSTTLSDITTVGTWSSSAPGTASVGSTTGVVLGTGASGTAIITYKLVSTGCITTAVVTVNPLPATITGPMSVCIGYTTTLSDASPGGTWSSGSANATVGTASVGVINGVSFGTARITYTIPTGCITTAVVTVNALPGPIAGVLTVCSGLTTSLSDTPGGGTWSSSATAIAGINSTSGLVTGGSVLSTSTSTITYTIGTGCSITAIVTVNPLPAAISGIGSVCAGLTTSLSDATPGGTWSSSAPAIASISSAGTVTGGGVLAASTATITYALSATGCIMTTVVTVNPLPTAILGIKSVCSGLTTSLSDASGSGTWTSSATGIAIVGSSSGVVTGMSVLVPSTSIITFTLPTTCSITTTVTVNPLPGAILGNLSVCPGLTTSLSDATAGGTWSSSSPATASVGTSGIVTGGIAGTAVITYTLPTSCIMTAVVTVNPLPSAISGNLAVCQGLTTNLSDVNAGGTWGSSNSAIASVSGGVTSTIVTGTATGSLALTATITYTLPTTCLITATITVNPLPAAITGALNVCSGLTTQLSDLTPSGTWSSSVPGTASVDFMTGLVTGTGPFGTATITYKLPTGCISSAIVTVNPLPASIAGNPVVCQGLTTSLSDATPLGAWSSSAPGIATVSSGVVTGVLTGATTLATAIITYTLPTGCINTITVTVNPLPAAISGSLQVCYGLTTDLSDATPFGTWSSSNTNALIVPATGVVTGNAVGTSIITYVLSTGCLMTAVMTVNPLPATISGVLNVCAGFTTVLSDINSGGTWSTSNTDIGTAGSVSGGITGVSPGTVTVTYTLPTGCITTTIVTVNPQPAPIAGIAAVCYGSTTSLSDSPSGGTWSSSNSSIAPVSATGIVTGATVGNATITYSLAAGCISTVVVSVNPLPAVYTVRGGGSYCQGGSGVHIDLSGSNVGISYLLYYGSSATGYLAGSGSPLDFGLLTVGGTYTVRATDNITGCTANMLGSVSVIVTPTVAPTVSITTGVGDTVCPGTTVTFTPIPGNGGLSPTYTWSVNGVLVSVGSTYTFIPADGDIVTVTMVSDGVCVSPLTATGRYKIRVIPDGMPQVSIAIDPGDTVCQFAAATFTATPTFGGVTPTYVWYVNNVPQPGSGSVFSYAPSTGDTVSCKMISDYKCRTADTVSSNIAIMTVAPMTIPHVEIIPAQGFYIVQGNTDSLWTVVTNAGPDPTYQWEINGVPIPGATSSSLVRQFNNYDSVTCIVTSSGVCDGISTFDWVYITIIPAGVQQYAGSADIRLSPNPNKGAFTIKGSLGTVTDEDVSIEITDMLGQVVYKNKVAVQGGKINEQIRLNNGLSNGMYLLNLRSGSNNEVFHFVVEQ